MCAARVPRVCCPTRGAAASPGSGRTGWEVCWRKLGWGGELSRRSPCPQQSWRLGAGVAEVRTRRVPSGPSELAPIPQTWPAAAGAQRSAVSISALCSRAASSWALVSPDPHPPRVPAAQQAALGSLVRSLSAGGGGGQGLGAPLEALGLEEASFSTNLLESLQRKRRSLPSNC